MLEQDRFSNIQKFDWGSIFWLIEPEEETDRVSVGLVTFAPHMVQEEHSHIREEQVLYVLEGEGSHSIDGRHAKLHAGSYIHLPPHSRHQVTNESNGELRMLIVYTPSKIQHLLTLPVENTHSDKDSVTQPFFDVEVIRPLIGKLSQALGLSLAILDPQGKCLIKTENHPRMCSYLAEITQGAYCQEHLDKVFKEITDYNKPHFFFCCCNIASIIIPISYGDKIQAYLKCGEIFLSKEDKEQLIANAPRIAAQYTIDEDFFNKAVAELPVEPKSRLHTAAEATFAVANTIVGMMASALRQNELNSSRLSLVQEQLATATLEKALNESGLKLLQSQINPHFLFNTLNTIAQMAYIEGAKKTSELTCNLSELLRYTLRKTEQLITLDEELAILQSYINIQKERFGERISFHIAVDKSLGNVLVPCMIFQPLVENSIIHGLETKVQGGSIKISIKKDGAKVRAVVQDNGLGFYAPLLSSKEDKIGINSTKNRLAHHFGEHQSFAIHSNPGKGTSITIEFPLGENYE